ncbi:SDR family NAD(P)-dependent oxidoreductase [Sphingomonas solaris]|uniref:SDR family NAD(P)-dependent oxidoreductase n=1 Tax=Alterirhizorhabdus solaris TaxID=2529389 RepID=A0A558RD17_9SPHN|nr:SDR family NAD(P)-dependent oxidoreductase [Sphingomonas solaris]TVV77223.1 SDR family NAD(P)-dependent oxidoreductase [Sphingomonas solaris]
MANVVITGASRGIGLELARHYAAAGDRVFAFCRDPAGAEALATLATSSSGRLTAHAMDVADDASVQGGAAALDGAAVDVLINNAGINPPGQGLAMTTEVFREVNEVMLIGPFRVLQAFLPNLERAGTARVMNVTSQIGASTWRHGGYYAYAAAKAGLNRLMRSMSVDVKARGILIGLVHPGFVQTDMGGSGADISPAQSAAGIAKGTAALTPETTGGFFDWTGAPHRW